MFALIDKIEAKTARVGEALNDQAKPLRGSKILIYGVAYKRNVNDCRESPAFAIIHGLQRRGARVSYMDPFIARIDAQGIAQESVDLGSDFGQFDAVVSVTDHTVLERSRL